MTSQALKSILFISALFILGCNDPNVMPIGRIDHKDEPGEYREAVCSHVLKRFNSPSRTVADRAQMIGTWKFSPTDLMGRPRNGPAITYQFLESGQCITTFCNERLDRNKWSLNEDGTFSLLRWFKADPQYNLKEHYEENRYFLRALEDGRRVLWNGDGSLVMCLEKQSTEPGSAAGGSQPPNSETTRTSDATGSRR